MGEIIRSVIMTPVATFSANGMRTRGGPDTTAIVLCCALDLRTGALRLITPRKIADILEVSIFLQSPLSNLTNGYCHLS